ncbi:lysis system i-spanin subunit Rz [Pseudomonas sp. AL03]|uniref:lysis system i-spanin subunit Rz n=1 Tax=Pseudomonas sp. AL03 TaxID=3042230 RepID=UPI00249CC832|nr:lysis system i-spanin subunit Rz [Pseudomonas sp. AL03]MDI3272537.1 lysis system i-spanin subunit Rz [Pseudomonas sp. AL03]
MPAFGLMPMSYRVIGVVVFLAVLAGGSAALAWQFQDWRYGRQLAEQARLHAEALNLLTQAAATQQQTEQGKRLALEQRLSTSEQNHYRALSDAQRDQGRLRDRLATADLRLSVLLDANDAASACGVPTASSTGGVDHGAARARLDPTHAQRIITITDAGDSALIALQACQAYIRALAR